MRIISDLKKLDNPDRLLWWSIAFVTAYNKYALAAAALAVVVAIHIYLVY